MTSGQSALRSLSPSTGVEPYDRSRWSRWLPAVRNAVVGTALSIVHQAAGPATAETSEVTVPDLPGFALILRTGAATVQTASVAGNRREARWLTGEFTILPPGVESWWEVSPQGADGWLHMHFGAETTAAAIAEHGAPPPPDLVANDPLIAQLGRVALSLASRTAEPQQLSWDNLAQMVLFRVLTCRTGHPADPGLRGGLAGWQARRTTEYLAEHLAERVSLLELATMARLSPFHFARAFKQTVGVPPHRYQQRLRIDRATALLAETDLSSAEIATAVGYESAQALTRVFQQNLGITPAVYRRNLRL